MAKFKVEQDVPACIGCGACVAVCSSNWELKDTKDGAKGLPIKTDLNEIGCNQQAADACPVQCIKIVKK